MPAFIVMHVLYTAVPAASLNFRSPHNDRVAMLASADLSTINRPVGAAAPGFEKIIPPTKRDPSGVLYDIS